MLTHAVIISYSKYKQIHQVSALYNHWLMCYHQQKKKKENWTGSRCKAHILESFLFPGSALFAFHWVKLVTNTNYQHKMVLSTPLGLDTVTINLRSESFLSAGEFSVVLKTGDFLRERVKKPTCCTTSGNKFSRCQMLTNHVFGRVTVFCLYLIISVTGFPKCINL